MNEQIGLVEKKLLQIVSIIKKDKIDKEKLEVGIDELGISSIEFIKIVVECEMMWNIEFEPNKLNKEHFNSLAQIAHYIVEQSL